MLPFQFGTVFFGQLTNDEFFNNAVAQPEVGSDKWLINFIY